MKVIVSETAESMGEKMMIAASRTVSLAPSLEPVFRAAGAGSAPVGVRGVAAGDLAFDGGLPLERRHLLPGQRNGTNAIS